MGCAGDALDRAEAGIDSFVSGYLARQAADLAAVGVPDLTNPAGDAPTAGMRAYIEQFERAHTLAVREGSAVATWWLAHTWWADMASDDEPAADPLVRLGLLLAVPMDGLPVLIGDHLGGCDPVRPADIRATLDGLAWRVDGDRLRVSGQCGHPAIEVALREYVDRLPPKLAALAHGLPGLPLAVGIDLRAVPDGAGRPSYLAAGARFQLAEDRVRGLLMGEALYGDKSLAIRELYQNAVDATRHASARLEYLGRLHRGGGAPYEGEVSFVQDVEDGAEFIECADNGVGMGLDEITSVFAQAGMRSSDSKGFTAELADFAGVDPPVELWTNSRFGIGALSYFMLADRVDITTTRLNRDGSLGERLRVVIAGPGTCFRITSLGPGERAGTTVRLWLREPGQTSAIGTLGKVLVIAPVKVSASEPQAGGSMTWQPDVLGGECVPDVEHRVWWVAGEGRVLSDGLAVTTGSALAISGMVIDLRGVHAPTLSVDRLKILALNTGYLESALRSSVSRLLGEPDKARRQTIILSVLRGGKLFFSVRDALVEGLRRNGELRGELSGYETDLGRAGFVYHEPYLASLSPRWDDWLVSAACQGDDSVFAGVTDDQVVRPLPSDATLLWGSVELLKFLDVDATAGEWPLVALALPAARLRRPVADVAARYEALGIRFPGWSPSLRWDGTVAAVLEACDISTSWKPRLPVAEMTMAQVGIALGLTTGQVAQILDEWQVPREEILRFAERRPTMAEELFFYSNPKDFAKRFTRSSLAWVRRGEKLSISDLEAIANYLGRGLREVARMAKDMGLDVPMPAVDAVDERHSWMLRYHTMSLWNAYCAANQRGLSPDEAVKLANDLGFGLMPRGSLAKAVGVGTLDLPIGEPGALHRAAVLLAHQSSGSSTDDLTAAFEWAGFDLVGPPLGEIDNIDLSLVSWEYDGDTDMLDVADALNPYWVMGQAFNKHMPVVEARDRYQRLGFAITRPDAIVEPTTQLMQLVSRRSGGVNLWSLYDPGDVVSADRVLKACRETHLGLDDVLAAYAGLGLLPEDPRQVLPVRRPGPIEPQEKSET